MSLIDDLATAIARFEGFFSAGSVAQRNNNPGNLRAGIGQTGTDANGYAIFPDAATGFAALQNQISLNISRGLNLNTFFAGQRDSAGNVIRGGYPGYAPAADANSPAQYAATVAGWLGIDPNTPLSNIVSWQIGSSENALAPQDQSGGGVPLELPGVPALSLSGTAIAALALAGAAVLGAILLFQKGG